MLAVHISLHFQFYPVTMWCLWSGHITKIMFGLRILALVATDSAEEVNKNIKLLSPHTAVNFSKVSVKISSGVTFTDVGLTAFSPGFTPSPSPPPSNMKARS